MPSHPKLLRINRKIEHIVHLAYTNMSYDLIINFFNDLHHFNIYQCLYLRWTIWWWWWWRHGVIPRCFQLVGEVMCRM